MSVFADTLVSRPPTAVMACEKCGPHRGLIAYHRRMNNEVAAALAGAIVGGVVGWLGAWATDVLAHRRRRHDEEADCRRKSVAEFIAALEGYRSRCFDLHARLLSERQRLLNFGALKSLAPGALDRERQRGVELALSQRVELSQLRVAMALLKMEIGKGAILDVASSAVTEALDFSNDIRDAILRDEDSARELRDAWSLRCDVAMEQLVAAVDVS